ncbi:MAG: hypothetical protein RM021_011410 [Nostoc sp. EkiNYC01]|nr:hypothetical protein [Nostoc sp. EkiNYC01]
MPSLRRASLRDATRTATQMNILLAGDFRDNVMGKVSLDMFNVNAIALIIS